jgi:hypothetical protein
MASLEESGFEIGELNGHATNVAGAVERVVSGIQNGNVIPAGAEFLGKSLTGTEIKTTTAGESALSGGSFKTAAADVIAPDQSQVSLDGKSFINGGQQQHAVANAGVQTATFGYPHCTSSTMPLSSV